MEKVDVKFGDWLEQGFTLWKENIGVLVIPALLVLILSVFTLGILAGPMLAGLVLMILRLQDKAEPKPAIGDVFQGFQYFLNAFLFMLVYFVVSFVGSTILAIIPVIGGLLGYFFSFALMALVMFALFLIVDKKMDFWPAVMASVDKVKMNFWPFLGFAVVISVISALGLIACGIGIIVTMPFYYCAVAVAYRDVYGDAGGAPVVEPRTDEQKQEGAGDAPPPIPPA
jgi:uncharacterized membrane protein